VLRMQLRENGIAVDGEVRQARAPEDAPLLLRFEGRPLSEIVRLFVKYSNNATAETLVKGLSLLAAPDVAPASVGAAADPPRAPASWPAGVQELERRLVGLGLDPAGFSLVDGSGLSYENKVTPRTLVEALRRARTSFRFGPEFMAALPIASRDGTLQKRAHGAEGVVRAKTGLLTRITALSGFADLGGGERAVFSILVNGYRSSDEAAMGAVDRFVAELVRSDGDSGPETAARADR
jgi:serine-type D-Ala-D-Ala carboxypeptidase/endopeptidase (penicillin-binding protein 4)